MRPEFLKAGDTIGIVAPARHISSEELMPTINFLQRHQFRVQLGNHLFAKYNQFAGTDKERASDFQQMLDNHNIKAILCARGGYGSVRIIDKLDFSEFLKHPKWICGYSDITVFHSHLHRNFQISSIHCLMPVNITNSNESEQGTSTFLQAITGDKLTYQTPHNLFNRHGEASGVIVGGNISVLYALLSSSSDIDTKGKILFIEDLDEYLYHIDRMMMSLKRAGKLEHLSGLIVGGLSDMHDNTIPFGRTAEEIIAEHCQEFDFPIVFNFPAGHINPNSAIRLGETIHIKVTQNQGANIIF